MNAVQLAELSASKRQSDDIKSSVAYVARRVETVEFPGCKGQTLRPVTGVIPADQVLRDSLNHIQIEGIRVRSKRGQVIPEHEVFELIGVIRRVMHVVRKPSGMIRRHDSV